MSSQNLDGSFEIGFYLNEYSHKAKVTHRALLNIEKILGVSCIDLCRKIYAGQHALSEASVILTECVKASEDGLAAKAVTSDKMAEEILKQGLIHDHVMDALLQFATIVLTGGDPENQQKKREKE